MTKQEALVFFSDQIRICSQFIKSGAVMGDERSLYHTQKDCWQTAFNKIESIEIDNNLEISKNKYKISNTLKLTAIYIFATFIIYLLQSVYCKTFNFYNWSVSEGFVLVTGLFTFVYIIVLLMINVNPPDKDV